MKKKRISYKNKPVKEKILHARLNHEYWAVIDQWKRIKKCTTTTQTLESILDHLLLHYYDEFDDQG
jgi:hypothetical protein